MERFTGVKDADKEILKSIESDRDLISICLVNKYFSSLCDETFFHNRLLQKYPSLIPYKKDEIYKRFYLKMIYYIDKLKNEFQFDYDTGNPQEIYKFLSNFNKEGIVSNAMYAAPHLNSISLMDHIFKQGKSKKFLI